MIRPQLVVLTEIYPLVDVGPASCNTVLNVTATLLFNWCQLCMVGTKMIEILSVFWFGKVDDLI